jgi:hypothetical protein
VRAFVTSDTTQAFIGSSIEGARSEQAPRLWLAGNGSNVHWQIELIGVSTSSPQTRFALELHYVLDEHAADNTTRFAFANPTSIDDEYTPGVFRVSIFCDGRPALTRVVRQTSGHLSTMVGMFNGSQSYTRSVVALETVLR